jgi:spore germination protein KB
MIKEGRLGVFEATALIVILISYKVLLTSPRQLTELVATAAWLTTLISCGAAIVGFVFIYLLLKRFPNKNIIAIFKEVYGKYVYFIPSILVYLIFIYNLSITLREFSETLKSYILPKTPIPFIILVILISVIFVSILGLEVIARMASLATPPLLIGFFLILILGVNTYRFYNITPLLGTGTGMILKHGLLRSSVYGDVFILTIIATSMQGISHIKKVGFIGLPIAGVLVSVGLLCFNLASPYHVASEFLAPIIQLARDIEYGRFIQRLEPLSGFEWVFASLIALTAIFFVTLKVYCELFEIKNHKPLTFSLGLIIFCLSSFEQNISEVIMGQILIVREFSWIIYFILPLFTLIIAVIRGKKGAVKNAPQS